MSDYVLPCYYPTTVILIDDNKQFLNNLSLQLPDNVLFRSFSEPAGALKFINSAPLGNEMSEHETDDPDAVLPDQFSVKFNLRNIHQAIFNAQRFNRVSVIVVDYAMPGLNGLDLCKQINHPNIKKIMLTGEADNDIAVQAFNEKIIDHFILKSSPILSAKMVAAINVQQREYFKEQSQDLMKHFFSNASPSCLRSPEFINLFEQTIDELGIVEYYLMDDNGSFLLLDANAKPSWLAVKSEEEMADLLAHARFEEAPTDVIAALEEKIKLPYFYSEQDMQTTPSDWGHYLHDAQLLQGLQKHYFSVITQEDIYDIQPNKIKAFNAVADME